MAPKKAKPAVASPPPAAEKAGMGPSPAALAKRNQKKTGNWCPLPDTDFDAMCDPSNPKAILYKDIIKAVERIRDDIPVTPLVRSNCCAQLGMEMNYKLEIFHRTGSFNERGALNALLLLTPEQRSAGVITTSLGNWAMALAYHGKRLNTKITVVLPEDTLLSTVEKCREFKAKVVLHGEHFVEAKHHAFTLASEKGLTYINGYDHPDVIAGSGTIALEILEQLPDTDAIVVPVGGGGLLAGIAEAAKHVKPGILIYGVESDKSCCFLKAMENNEPYQTAVGLSVASSLGVSTAGYNAYHTAKSLIDKLVLVHDDWIVRSILHFIENEKLVIEGAGAITLGPILARPQVLPELIGKNVVCVISGGNLDQVVLPRCLERAKAAEGRLVKIIVTLPADGAPKEQLKVLSMISNVGCNVLQCYTESAWIAENNLHTIYLTLICETNDLEHACQLKRVMGKLFPGSIEFLEEPFSPIPTCLCFAKKRRP